LSSATAANGKPVLLLTGASGGIGAATAVEFARRGYALSLTAPDADALDAVAADARSLGATCETFLGDLCDLQFAEALVARTVAAFGRLDVLINNAARRELLTMRETSIDAWESALRLCLTAPAFLAKWSAEQMEKQRKGTIINVSSIMSVHPSGISPAYVAAKGALEALTYDLAALYGSRGVRVLAIQPGAIDTPMSAGLARTGPANPPPDGQPELDCRIRDWSGEMIPLGRWGRPEEIARAVAFFASDEASYISGATLLIDGGWSHQLYPQSIKHLMKPDQFP
jgi:NAD(P)-dependent dehydrogenase (short-subunit alcohol dehydrogenase family)